MTEDGLLDNFPVHLVLGGSGESALLVLDSSDFGRLQLNPVPEIRRTVIALSQNRKCLEKTRKAMRNFDQGEIHLVQADPQRLPFHEQSIGVIVTLSSRKGKAERSIGRPCTSAGIPEDLTRVLTPEGWILDITRMRDWQANRNAEDPESCTKTQSYYVRPTSGYEYFVTRKWVPSRWPFGFLRLGVVRSMRIAADLIISRLRIRPLYDSVGVMVLSRATGEALLEKSVSLANDQTYGEKANPFSHRGFGLFVMSRWKALLLMSKKSEEIVKFPLNSVAAMRMKKHAENIDALNDSEIPALNHFLPSIVGRGIVCGQAYWAETRCRGIPGTKLWWLPGWRRKVRKSGFQFLMDLHRNTCQPARIVRSLFDDLVRPHVAIMEEEARRIDTTFNMTPLVEALWRVFRNRRMPFVRTHGDFWPGNLQVSKKGKLEGVLDWDESAPRGWPLLDLLHFIGFQYKRRLYWRFGSVITKTLMPGRIATWEHAMVRQYCAALAIESDLWVGFVAIYWLERVSQWIQTDLDKMWYDETWLRRNVIEPLPQILKQVSAMCLP